MWQAGQEKNNKDVLSFIFEEVYLELLASLSFKFEESKL